LCNAHLLRELAAVTVTPPREVRMVGGPAGPLMLRFMGSRAGRPMIRKFFADFTHTGGNLSREATDGHWQPLHEGGTRAFRAFAVELDAMMAQFAHHAEALRRLDVPATVIWGTADPVLRHERLVPRFVADLRISQRTSTFSTTRAISSKRTARTTSPTSSPRSSSGCACRDQSVVSTPG